LTVIMPMELQQYRTVIGLFLFVNLFLLFLSGVLLLRAGDVEMNPGPLTLDILSHQVQTVLGIVSGNKQQNTEIQRQMSSNQYAVSQDLSEIKQHLSWVTRTVQENSNNIGVLHNRLQQSQQHTEVLRRELDRVQSDLRRKNLKMMGVREGDSETSRSLIEKVVDTFNYNFQDLSLQLEDVVDCVRVGRRRSDGDRPVIVTFRRSETSMIIMTDRVGRQYMSSGDGIRVGPDLTPSQREEAQRLRTEGKRWYLKDGSVRPVDSHGRPHQRSDYHRSDYHHQRRDNRERGGRHLHQGDGDCDDYDGRTGGSREVAGSSARTTANEHREATWDDNYDNYDNCDNYDNYSKPESRHRAAWDYSFEQPSPHPPFSSSRQSSPQKLRHHNPLDWAVIDYVGLPDEADAVAGGGYDEGEGAAAAAAAAAAAPARSSADVVDVLDVLDVMEREEVGRYGNASVENLLEGRYGNASVEKEKEVEGRYGNASVEKEVEGLYGNARIQQNERDNSGDGPAKTTPLRGFGRGSPVCPEASGSAGRGRGSRGRRSRLPPETDPGSQCSPRQLRSRAQSATEHRAGEMNSQWQKLFFPRPSSAAGRGTESKTGRSRK